MPSKKRRASPEAETDTPPRKRQRVNEDDQKDLEASPSATDQKEEVEIQSLTDVRQVLDFNATDLSSRAEVVGKFRSIATTLMRDTVMSVCPPDGEAKLFRFVEVEFYFLDGRLHPDVYAHCDKLQLETCGCWYFHRGGNNSMEGYQLMTRRADSEPRIIPHFTDEEALLDAIDAKKSYRSGTYKGLDITFARENTAFGGMLIRAIEEYNPVHSAFTRQGGYSAGQLIEGPSNTVGHILEVSGMDKINDLEKQNGWTLDCFDENNSVLHLKWANDYPSAGQTRSRGTIDFYEKPCHASPRVGLTFKQPGGLHADVLNKVSSLKQEFIVAPYRFIRTSQLSNMKKFKHWVFLSLLAEYASRGDGVQAVQSFMGVKAKQGSKWIEPYEAGKAEGKEAVGESFKGKGKFSVGESCRLMGGLFPGFQ